MIFKKDGCVIEISSKNGSVASIRLNNREICARELRGG